MVWEQKFSHDFAEQGAKLVLMDIAEERVEISKELADEFKVETLTVIVCVILQMNMM